MFMDISRIIQDLILKNDTVSIRGLGTFARQYNPAEVYKYSNKVTPPSYMLIFVSETDDDDNSLIQTLTEEYDSNVEQSTEAVDVWVKKILTTLDAGNSYYIKELGTLSRKNERVAFEPEKNSSLLSDSFGLETIKLPLMEIDSATEKQAEPETFSMPNKVSNSLISINSVPKWIRYAAFVVLIIGIAIGLYVSGYMQKGFNSVNETISNFMSKSTTTQMATNDTLNGKADANELKRRALKYSEEKIDTSGSQEQAAVSNKIIRYYIISQRFLYTTIPFSGYHLRRLIFENRQLRSL
jgi:nucleoid DNA-binding protein